MSSVFLITKLDLVNASPLTQVHQKSNAHRFRRNPGVVKGALLGAIAGGTMGAIG